MIEGVIIGAAGCGNNGVVGLVSLDESIGNVNMSATDTAKYLREQVKSAFFGGVIWQGKASIGLDDSDGGKMG